jgi:hypothetical protein
MKSKTLITMAVASTFGWSAGAFAAGPYEVQTPSSVSESGENIVALNDVHMGAMSAASGPTESLIEATGHDLALSDTSDWSTSADQMAEAQVGDVYVVGFAPMDTWDYYVIDTGDSVALLDDSTYYLVPMDVVFITGDDAQDQSDSAIVSEAPSFDSAG